MTAISSLQIGAGRLRKCKRLVGLFYLVNLAAAAMVAVPVAAFLSAVLSNRPESARLFGNVDADWVIETLVRFNYAPVTTTTATLMAIGVVYLLISTFLAGGAIAVLYRDHESFFAASARFFPRLFRILLVSILFYGIALAMARALNAVHGSWAENSMSDAAITMSGWAVRATGLLLILLVNTLFDYAKIVCVVEDRAALRSVLGAMQFVSRNTGAVLLLFVALALVSLAFLAAYHGLSEWIGQSSMGAVALLFLLRQLYMLARFWTRLWTWSSEIAFFGARQPAAQPEPLSEPAVLSDRTAAPGESTSAAWGG